MATNLESHSSGRYQLLDQLRPEELVALESDIKKRGVLVPVELDEEGNILDGHHRAEIADRLGIPYETLVRRFDSEEAKREHVVMINLARRHLDPIRWGRAFDQLLAVRGVKRGRGARNDGTSLTIREVAGELGVDPKTAEWRLAQADAYVALNAEARGRIDDGDATLQQVRREQKEQARAARRQENQRLVEAAPTLKEALGTAKFSTIVVDPPWDPADEGEAHGEGLFGRRTPPYATMPIEDIRNLSVGTYADANCHIYLWITNRSLFKGETLLEAWGFRYVTALTWVKRSYGMGSYFRGATEHALFGVRGSQPLQRHDVGTWFEAPRGPDGHSSKPAEFFELVESCSPGPYLEVFARGQRDGWVCWGAEAASAATTDGEAGASGD